MKRKSTYLALFLFLSSFCLNVNGLNSALATDKNVELTEAKENFYNGEFEGAIKVLERLVATKTLSKEDYVDASEFLAVAYVSLEQDGDAEAVFANVLQKDPEYKPSDLWWPHKRMMAGYYRTVKNSGQSLEVKSKSPGIKTVAIIDFENNSIDDAEKYNNLGGALSKILISDFMVMSNLKVVERERLQFLVDELELSAKTIGGQKVVDPASAPQLGKFLGAHSFIFGSFIKLGNTFRLDVRLVKTETGEIFKTASVEGKPDKIFELAKKLTLQITKDLDIAIRKTEKKQLDAISKNDVPIEAVALFGDAMSQANGENYDLAVVKLEAAIALAPGFQKAQDMMTVIRPLTL